MGGGNIIRGMSAANEGLDRVNADYMGMLASIMNAHGAPGRAREGGPHDARAHCAVDIHEVAEPYIRRRAIRHLEKGRVVIFAAGTGNPYFTTDTAAALRAVEIHAEVVLKATKVDGVYDADPMKNPDATRYDELTFDEAIQKNLQLHGPGGHRLCRGEPICPIVVFDMNEWRDNIAQGRDRANRSSDRWVTLAPNQATGRTLMADVDVAGLVLEEAARGAWTRRWTSLHGRDLRRSAPAAPRARAARRHPGRLLRHGDAAQPARQPERPPIPERMIVINPYDKGAISGEIERAIQKPRTWGSRPRTTARWCASRFRR